MMYGVGECCQAGFEANATNVWLMLVYDHEVEISCRLYMRAHGNITVNQLALLCIIKPAYDAQLP